ncbi:unnamed protein product [Penicillium viridicatum]
MQLALFSSTLIYRIQHNVIYCTTYSLNPNNPRMSTKLFVVFYRPRYGNFLHWALHIEKGQEHHILEVDGEHPQFKRNTFMENPKESCTFLRQFFIAVLGEDDVERVKSAAQSVPVDNETVEWDCQDYVLEILDKLQEDFILDKDDEDYIDVREILTEERGGIV